MLIKQLSLVVLLAPLLGSLIAGWAGRFIGKRGAHWVTITLMILSFSCAVVVLKLVIFDRLSFNGPLYTWGVSGNFRFDVGFLIDNLTAVMMTVVTFVSMLVHLYSVGYMTDDPSNQRFFFLCVAIYFRYVIAGNSKQSISTVCRFGKALAWFLIS